MLSPTSESCTLEAVVAGAITLGWLVKAGDEDVDVLEGVGVIDGSDKTV